MHATVLLSTRRLALLLAALLVVGCSVPSPARRAANRAAAEALSRLEGRRSLPQLAVIGGLRPQGMSAAESLDDLDDPLAEELAQAVESALHEGGLRVVDHRNMPLALDVLKVEMTDLFPEDESGEDTLRRLGRYLKADLYVTGTYVLIHDDPADVLLDLRVLDLHTLEVLANASGRSRGGAQRGAEGALYGLKVVTTPIPGLWDMLTYATDRSYGDEQDLDGWGLLKAIGMWPIHLIASPVLADWRSVRWWLDLDEHGRRVIGSRQVDD